MSSDHRRPEIPFSDASRGTCRWCGDPIVYLEARGRKKKGEPDLRRRWHPACVEAYDATDPRMLRDVVRKRDRGICAECGLDTNVLKRRVKGRGRADRLRELGFKVRKSLWELDHIVPLIDGGGHELANLQTLCTPCHKEKTAGEARARAARRAQGEGMAAEAEGGRRTKTIARDDERLAHEIDRLLDLANTTNTRAEAALAALGRR